jgi:IS30 family transposase
MAQHKALSVATDVKVYFCDPQSPWQRGSNENTNGLLRHTSPTAQTYRYIHRRN